MKPLEAFQYLLDHDQPIILTFPFEEEKGHVITGTGICHIEKIKGSSRITLCRFNPKRLIYHLKKSRSFHANFEIKGETYFCAIEGLTVSGSAIIIDIPVSLNTTFRRFSRIEPSLRLPVMLHVYTPQDGTVSFPVKDITEEGLSFIARSLIAVENTFMCGLQIPIDGGLVIFTNATVVYKIGFAGTDKKAKKPGVLNEDILYGLALFPHTKDVEKIRSYIVNRNLEIEKKIREGFRGKSKSGSHPPR
jgi:hypothetical protein